jgi:transcriptional regulator with XRE-family HTH domain
LRRVKQTRGIVAKGEAIVALRKAAGLTQEKLAAECDSDVKTVRTAERGKPVDVATLRRISARLGIELRELFADNSPDRREANIAVALACLRAFDARDPDAVAAYFREDGTVIVYADPRLPGAGEYRGRKRIRHWAESCFAAYMAPPVAGGKYRVEAAGELVFLSFESPELESLTTGRLTRASLMSEYEITDGNISTLRIFPESGAVERIALLEGARPNSR